MRSSREKSKWIALSVYLFVGMLTGGLFITLYAHSTSAAVVTKQEIEITVDGLLYKPESKPYVSKGTVYVPLRDISKALKAVVGWEDKTKRVTLTKPEQTVVLTLGKTTATRNGAIVKLSTMPIVKDSHVYVPIRVAAEILGEDVDWKSKTQTVEIVQKIKYEWISGVNSTYWLNRTNGKVYEAKPYNSQPKPAGTMNIQLEGYNTLRISSSNGSDQLILEDYYGEPMINMNLYTALIVKGSIVKQTKVHYWQRYSPNITYEDNNPVMTDGKTLFLMNPAGKVTNEYDLVALNGLDQIYSIEGIGENYVLVRPNRTGLLTLILLETSERIELYKQLDTQEQEYAETNDVPYHGDNLQFVEEKDAMLHFTYTSIFDNKNHEITYKL